MYTTLNRIRGLDPCKYRWETLLKYLGKTSPDDEPLPLLTILDSNGFDHALWCFRAVEGFEKEKQLLAITFAREVEHLMPAESKKALDVFERYANGLATEKEFEVARRAADDASYAALAKARAAVAWVATHSAYAVAADAADAAYAASHAVACAVAHAAAVYAVAHAASAATRSSIKAKQETQLRQVLEKTK